MSRWVPLESNPDVLNQYIHQLGAPHNWKFHDVFSLDPETFEFIPRPHKAIIFLFPIRHDSAVQSVTSTDPVPPSAFFVLQRIGWKNFLTFFLSPQSSGNACGTIALLHAFGNNADEVSFRPGSWFERFFARAKGLPPAQRGL